MISADGHLKSRRNEHNEEEVQAFRTLSRILLRDCPIGFRRFADGVHHGVKCVRLSSVSAFFP
jgi:hypothetical protein